MLDSMTNVKASEVLKELKMYSEDLPHYSPDDEVAEALEMAIKALEAEPCEDCISREDAIRIASINSMPVNECVRLIKELPSVKPQTRWIPVSERLPEENGQYLITVKYKPEADYEDIYAEHGEWADGRWDMFCFAYCGEVEGIVAWMPLPQPYKV